MKCLKTGTLLYIFLLWCDDIESVLVEIEQGCLRGEIKTTITNCGKYNSFKGIPYAAPPVGDLRFRAPQPPLKWKGIRNATEHGSICVQLDTNGTAIGSEDCLYLNVYSPDLSPDCPLAVMVLIHGDTFFTGSGNYDKYDPNFLIPYDVVLVTLNFRLSALGFLAMDTKDVPGNAGMKDQIAALKWVQRNIEKFGGDPDRVTIFGNSAGAAMVTLHVVAPSAKNLFQRAIAMSGCFFVDWAIAFEPVRRAFALGRELGLVTNDTTALTKFLKSLEPEKLVQASPNLLISDKVYKDILLLTYFTPTVEKKIGNGEGQFLTTCPRTLMRKRRTNQVDFMMGHTGNEGLQTLAEFENVILEYFPKYREIVVPLKISYARNPDTVLNVTDAIQNFYFGNEIITKKILIPNFDRFNTYERSLFDIHSLMESLPVYPSVHRYFYVFRIYSSRNYYGKLAAQKFGVENATHRDDLLYLFNGSLYNLPPVDVNSKEFEYIQLMCKLYTNFAKYGNPTPDDSLGATWPEYDTNKGFMSIERDGSLVPGIVPLYTNADLIFWRKLYLSLGVDPYNGYSPVNRTKIAKKTT